MSACPKSLLQLANAPLHPSPLAHSVLVIVDAQLEYVAGALPLAGIDAAIGEARAMLDVARREGVPVIHVVHHSPPGRGAFDRAGPLVAIVPELTPDDGESVIAKTLPNAFGGTDLENRIRETGRRELILAGFMTHVCISTTVRAALDLGFRITVVAGATATRDLPDPLGGPTIPAAEVQRVALAELADRFAIVVPDAAALQTNC